MEMLTKEQAIEMYGSDWWKGKPAHEVARFQLEQDRLCMPFAEFHKAVEEALGRPVWTHEFGLNRQGLIKELDWGMPGTDDAGNH